MMTRNVMCVAASALLLLLATAPFIRAQAQPSQPLLVVVVASATGMTDIGLELLRRAFEGYPAEYRAGKRLLPLNHPLGNEARVRFDRVVLGLAPNEVGRYWVDQRIRGASHPPRTLASAELAVRVVASFAGAITYTTSSVVTPGVTVLTIDGKAPSAAGYAFAR